MPPWPSIAAWFREIASRARTDADRREALSNARWCVEQADAAGQRHMLPLGVG